MQSPSQKIQKFILLFFIIGFCGFAGFYGCTSPNSIPSVSPSLSGPALQDQSSTLNAAPSHDPVVASPEVDPTNERPAPKLLLKTEIGSEADSGADDSSSITAKLNGEMPCLNLAPSRASDGHREPGRENGPVSHPQECYVGKIIKIVDSTQNQFLEKKLANTPGVLSLSPTARLEMDLTATAESYEGRKEKWKFYLSPKDYSEDPQTTAKACPRISCGTGGWIPIQVVEENEEWPLPLATLLINISTGVDPGSYSAPSNVAPARRMPLPSAVAP